MASISRIFRRSLGAALLVFVLTGCDAPGSARDRELVDEITRAHGGRIELTLEENLYLRARSRSGTVSEPEMQQVYQAFFFEPGGGRRTTGYVYLNVYDAEDRFLFQLFHDPNRGRLIRSSAERY